MLNKLHSYEVIYMKYQTIMYIFFKIQIQDLMVMTNCYVVTGKSRKDIEFNIRKTIKSNFIKISETLNRFGKSMKQQTENMI